MSPDWHNGPQDLLHVHVYPESSGCYPSASSKYTVCTGTWWLAAGVYTALIKKSQRISTIQSGAPDLAVAPDSYATNPPPSAGGRALPLTLSAHRLIPSLDTAYR
jgi:hypothetical protein